MTEYADLKIEPCLREVLKNAAAEQYGSEFRAISVAGHEAAIAWLIFRADHDARQQALNDAGFEDVDDLIHHLTDGTDGRFEGEPKFDPLAAIQGPTGQIDD